MPYLWNKLYNTKKKQWGDSYGPFDETHPQLTQAVDPDQSQWYHESAFTHMQDRAMLESAPSGK